MTEQTNTYFRGIEERGSYRNDGEGRAYRSWWRSEEAKASRFEVEDLPWDKDLPDFVAALREAGVTEFAVTDQSTALMRCLHILAANGCTIEGLCTVERTEWRFRGDCTVSREGILVRL